MTDTSEDQERGGRVAPPDTGGPAARRLGPAALLPRAPYGSRDRGARPYARPSGPDPDGREVLHAATRALLAVRSRQEAAAVLQTAVRDLGGAVVPAWLEPRGALPVDVSLGVTEPLVIVVEPGSLAALHLTTALPALVEDAMAAAAGADDLALQRQRAGIDHLTGVASRAEIGPALGRARPGDLVVLLDLDHFKAVNDGHGHAAGDEVLRELGRRLRAHTRAEDFCGRYGGDEFVVILPGASGVEELLPVVDRLVATWNVRGTTVSAGVAVVDARGGPAALRAADRALYRAKAAGRNRVVVAGPEDVEAEPAAGVQR